MDKVKFYKNQEEKLLEEDENIPELAFNRVEWLSKKEILQIAENYNLKDQDYFLNKYQALLDRDNYLFEEYYDIDDYEETNKYELKLASKEYLEDLITLTYIFYNDGKIKKAKELTERIFNYVIYLCKGDEEDVVYFIEYYHFLKDLSISEEEIAIINQLYVELLMETPEEDKLFSYLFFYEDCCYEKLVHFLKNEHEELLTKVLGDTFSDVNEYESISSFRYIIRTLRDLPLYFEALEISESIFPFESVMKILKEDYDKFSEEEIETFKIKTSLFISRNKDTGIFKSGLYRLAADAFKGDECFLYGEYYFGYELYSFIRFNSIKDSLFNSLIKDGDKELLTSDSFKLLPSFKNYGSQTSLLVKFFFGEEYEYDPVFNKGCKNFIERSHLTSEKLHEALKNQIIEFIKNNSVTEYNAVVSYVYDVYKDSDYELDLRDDIRKEFKGRKVLLNRIDEEFDWHTRY